jgi:hypothetical protein
MNDTSLCRVLMAVGERQSATLARLFVSSIDTQAKKRVWGIWKE